MAMPWCGSAPSAGCHRPEKVGGAFDGATARKPVRAQLETAAPTISDKRDARKLSVCTFLTLMAGSSKIKEKDSQSVFVSFIASQPASLVAGLGAESLTDDSARLKAPRLVNSNDLEKTFSLIVFSRPCGPRLELNDHGRYGFFSRLHR